MSISSPPPDANNAYDQIPPPSSNAYDQIPPAKAADAPRPSSPLSNWENSGDNVTNRAETARNSLSLGKNESSSKEVGAPSLKGRVTNLGERAINFIKDSALGRFFSSIASKLSGTKESKANEDNLDYVLDLGEVEEGTKVLDDTEKEITLTSVKDKAKVEVRSIFNQVDGMRIKIEKAKIGTDDIGGWWDEDKPKLDEAIKSFNNSIDGLSSKEEVDTKLKGVQDAMSRLKDTYALEKQRGGKGL